MIDRTPVPEVAGVIIPWFTPANRPTEDRLQETAGLVEALGCNLAFLRAEHVRKVNSSVLLSGGILDRLAEDLRQNDCTVAVVDGDLTPVQQRNLERKLEVKVIDRTGLILEIFGLRARTKEGRLQVELARLLYERSRLVRTWTHLERQRGGDMPFATLDPTIRRFDLPTLGEAALIDTVGFITDLPTHLIDSFQATLEEAMQADLLVHVRDRSSRADLEQAEDVMIVLEQLEAETGLPLPPMIEVWNKADLLPDDRADALAFSARGPLDTPAVLVSALTGTGINELLDLIEAVLLKGATEIELELGTKDGRARAWLHRNGEVLSETTLDSGNVVMTARLPNDRLGQFYSEFPDFNPA